MAEYAAEYGYFEQSRDLMWSRKLNTKTLTLKQFLESTKWKGQKLSY